MSVLYNLDKANFVADALSRTTMGNVSPIEKGHKHLVKDVARLCRLGVWLEDSPNGVFVVRNNS